MHGQFVSSNENAEQERSFNHRTRGQRDSYIMKKTFLEKCSMFHFIYSPRKKYWLLLVLPLVLLCGCSPSQASQAAPSAHSNVQQAAPTPTWRTPLGSPTPTVDSQTAPPTPTADAQQVASTPTVATQVSFTSYVGTWEVHGSLLSIKANQTGREQWNVGLCSSAGQMCNGMAQVTFRENADGSIKGTIQSVSYSQWNGNPAPAGFQPNSADPQTGDTFQLQRSGVHLLYTTWFGVRLSSLNSGNRYWCDRFALKAGWKQCGA